MKNKNLKEKPFFEKYKGEVLLLTALFFILLGYLIIKL